MKTKLFSALLVSVLLTSVCFSQDWPRWRGQNLDDISTAENLLQEWPEGGPELAWVFKEGGLGYAGFSIVGDRLFTMGLEGEQEFGLCLNAETGKEIWRTELGSRYKNKWGDGPRSTPAVDEDRVYFMAARGDLVCLNLGDGSKVWSQKMTEFGGTVPKWGYAESPLVDGDHVFCTPGGNDGAIVALDKLSGEKAWQTEEVTSIAHYSSILLAEHNSKKQLVQLLHDKVVGVDRDSGDVVWQTGFLGKVAVIPSPIFSDGKVYVTAGYGVGSKLIDISAGDPVDVYQRKTMKNHHGGVILLDGNLYGYSDGEGFICQSFESGERLWNEKRKIKKGAVSYADGRFYFIEERSGDVILLHADSEGWSEHGRFTLSPQTERRKPDGRIWVHPVIANGKMYVRDQEFIHCYDISAGN